jgi:Flp pilus assembly protein protease CpaA
MQLFVSHYTVDSTPVVKIKRGYACIAAFAWLLTRCAATLLLWYLLVLLGRLGAGDISFSCFKQS